MESKPFPNAAIEIEGRTYHVQKTQILTDCKLATTGELAPAYAKLGCHQLIRATILSPDKSLVATIGVFNFVDQTAATTAKAHTKTALTSYSPVPTAPNQTRAIRKSSRSSPIQSRLTYARSLSLSFNLGLDARRPSDDHVFLRKDTLISEGRDEEYVGCRPG